MNKHRVRRRGYPPVISAALLLALAGCGDLPMTGGSPMRTPTRVELQLDRTLLTVGDTVSVTYRVLDQHGQPLEQLPPWTAPVWSSSPMLNVTDGRLEAVSSGSAIVRVQLAGLSAVTQLRINPASLRVTVAAAYLTQGIQTLVGSVPLIANRHAQLRVFVTGDQVNFFAPPQVLAHFYRGGELIATLDASLSTPALPVSVDEGVLSQSWNMFVPGSLLQPGTSFRVEVAPNHGLPADPSSVLRFPASGERTLNIREVAPFRVTLVPINIQGAGLPNLSDLTVNEFMEATRQVWPLNEVDVQIREPYSTATQSATSQDWSKMLQEIYMLRLADGSSRYYHGILRRQGAWAGLAYIGYPVGLTYDQLPQATWTLAHEFGHNFGRWHAPCGGPAGVDGGYPYSEAQIGSFGLTGAGAVVPPTTRDLMSYCSPQWISDYTFMGALQFREMEAMAGAAAHSPPPGGHQPALLITGTLRGDALELGPAVVLSAPPSLPDRPGPFTLEALDAAGGVVFSHSFAGARPSEGPADERHFAFAIPLDNASLDRIATLRLRGHGRAVERRSTIGPERRRAMRTAPVAIEGTRMTRPGAGRVALRWNAAQYPFVVVRNPATGAIVSIARGGTADFRSQAGEFDVHFSDGVSSVARRLRPAQ